MATANHSESVAKFWMSFSFSLRTENILPLLSIQPSVNHSSNDPQESVHMLSLRDMCSPKRHSICHFPSSPLAFLHSAVSHICSMHHWLFPHWPLLPVVTNVSVCQHWTSLSTPEGRQNSVVWSLCLPRLRPLVYNFCSVGSCTEANILFIVISYRTK